MPTPTPLRSERHVPLRQAWNLRHVGGYTTVSSRVTAAGPVWRADGIHRCDADDLDRIAELGITTVVDLRTHHERDEYGHVDLSEHGVEARHHPVLRDTWGHDGVSDDTPAHEFLAERYLEMAEEGAGPIIETLEVIASAGGRPVLFHCTAGKDRTGVIAALLLALVGVDDATIAADYGLTAEATADFLAWLAEHHPDRHTHITTEVPAVFLASPPAAMLMFLDGLRHRHGSAEGWATHHGFGTADVERLRHHLLT